jgi:hypothetical protein
MQPRERLGIRLTLGALLGAAWSLIPAAFVDDLELAWFLAGVPTGMFVTWLYTCTSLELPQVYALVLLPVGNVTAGVLFGAAHCALTGGVNDVGSYYAGVNWVAIHMTVFSFYPPVFLALLAPALASTCLLSAMLRKRRPRRRDLLPERWDESLAQSDPPRDN